MFGKKSLNELVSTFLADNSERRQGSNSRINALEEEIGATKANIETETQRLVEAELTDDHKGRDDAQKAIHTLQLDLERGSGLVNALRAELGKAGHDEKILANIRIAAVKEREVRLKRVKTLTIEREGVERQIKLLEAKSQEIDDEISQALVDAEVKTLLPIVGHINPQAAGLHDYERERFIQRWVAGEDTSVLFDKAAKQEQPREGSIKITHTEHMETVEPKCVGRTYHLAGEGRKTLPLDS